MDAQQINQLNTQQRERYAMLEALFNSAGWKYVVEQAQAGIATQEARILNAQSWDQHLHASGARAVYLQFAHLQEMVENEFAQLADDAAVRVNLTGGDRDFL